MAYTIKQYAGNAAPTTLAASIGPTDGSIQGMNLTNYPDGSVGPFVVTLNLGGATEEKVLCSARSGNTLTVAVSGRGYDGTTAASHTGGTGGESITHTISAVDMREANYAVTQTVGLVQALGDLIVGSAPNTFVRLPIGTTGQVPVVAGGTLAFQTLNPTPILGVAGVTSGQTITSATAAAFPTPVSLAVTVPASGKLRFDYGMPLNTAGAAGDGIRVAIAATAGANSGNTDAGTLGSPVGASVSDFILAAASINPYFSASIYITGLVAGSTTFQLYAKRATANNVNVAAAGTFIVSTG